MLKLPIAFNCLVKKNVPHCATPIVDLSNTSVVADFSTSAPVRSQTHAHFFSPSLFFLVQKLEGLAKHRTVREAPTACICPPGKWMFDARGPLISRGRASCLLSALNCRARGQEADPGFQAVCRSSWTTPLVGSFFLCLP